MRIIQGSLRGKKISVPKNFPSRPTTDFAKEGLFNILNNLIDFENMEILDLCAGTGNISFEFISRGVKFLMCVDSNSVSAKFINKKINEFNLEDKMQFYKSDCILFCKNSNKRFDLIFADLPFHLKIHDQLLENIFSGTILKKDGKLILEHGKDQNFELYHQFSFSRNFGNVIFSFFNFN